MSNMTHQLISPAAGTLHFETVRIAVARARAISADFPASFATVVTASGRVYGFVAGQPAKLVRGEWVKAN